MYHQWLLNSFQCTGKLASWFPTSNAFCCCKKAKYALFIDRMNDSLSQDQSQEELISENLPHWLDAALMKFYGAQYFLDNQQFIIFHLSAYPLCYQWTNYRLLSLDSYSKKTCEEEGRDKRNAWKKSRDFLALNLWKILIPYHFARKAYKVIIDRS